jgi:hypothetical protein
VRMRGRKFHTTVTVQDGDSPIVVGLGFATVEASVDEARQLAIWLCDAIDTVRQQAASPAVTPVSAETGERPE